MTFQEGVSEFWKEIIVAPLVLLFHSTIRRLVKGLAAKTTAALMGLLFKKGEKQMDAEHSVELKGGKLVAKVELKQDVLGGAGALKLNGEVELSPAAVAKPLFDFLKEKIPGHFEDAILDGALEKLKSL